MNLPRLTIVLLVPALLGTDVRAAQDSSSVASRGDAARGEEPPELPAWHEMVTNLPGDWVRSAESAARPHGVLTIAGLTLLTGGLIAADQTMYLNSRRSYERSSFVHTASDVLVRAGNGGTHLALAAGFGLYGWVTHDARSLRTASQTVEALLASGVLVQLLKRVTGRESPPEATRDAGRWHLFGSWRLYEKHPSRYYAFPSGHITTTMATVTVIAENFPDEGWIRPVGYSVVGLLGVSLVNVGYHWYSDLPLGIAIGYTFGMIAAHRDFPHPGGGTKDSDSGLRVLPSFVAGGGPGLMVAVQF